MHRWVEGPPASHYLKLNDSDELDKLVFSFPPLPLLLTAFPPFLLSVARLSTFEPCLAASEIVITHFETKSIGGQVPWRGGGGRNAMFFFSNFFSFPYLSPFPSFLYKFPMYEYGTAFFMREKKSLEKGI